MKFSKTLSILASLALFLGLGAVNASPASASVNAANELIFFDQGVGHTGLKRMRFDGTNKTTYNISSLIASPDIRTMTSDGTTLYFVNNGDGVYSMNLDGSSLTKILTGSPSDLFIYGTKIYYTLWSGGLSSMNLDGSSPTSLALASAFPGSSSTGLRSLYVDGTYAWVTHGTGGGGTDGHVYRVPIAGGTPVLAYTDTGSAGVNGITGSGDNIFIRSGNNGKLFGLSRSAMIAGTQSAPASELYANNQGSEVELAGGKLYVTTNSDVYELDLSSYVQSSPALLPATALNLNASFTAANPRSMVVFAAKSVQFDSNGGVGSMSSQSTAFSLTLSANAFTKANHVFAYWYTNSSCSTGGSILNDGASYTPSADVTLYACWRGAVAVSLTPGGATVDAYDFGTVQTGSTNTVTLYFANLGDVASRPVSFSNASIASGVNLTYGGGTCNFSGGSLAIGTPCSTVVTWQPTSALNLNPSTHSVIVQASAIYEVKFSGSAVNARVVTFDANGGSGSMNNQTSVVSQNLAANAFTRSGYTFAGWNTVADGSGSSYADAAAYMFTASVTLYAQWALIPVPVSSAPTFPQLTGVSAKSFTEGQTQKLTLEGNRFTDLESASIDGKPVTILSSSGESITLDLGALTAGTYSLLLKFKTGSLVYQDGVKILAAKPANPTTQTVAVRKLIAGFAGDSSSVPKAVRELAISVVRSVPNAKTLTCTGSTSNTKITAKDVALAKARATALCASVQKKFAGLAIQIRVNPSSGPSARARNVLIEVSN